MYTTEGRAVTEDPDSQNPENIQNKNAVILRVPSLTSGQVLD